MEVVYTESDWCRNLNILYDKLFNSNGSLTQEELLNISKKINSLKDEISIYQENILRLGQILDLMRLKNNGFSVEDLKKFYEEDNLIVEKAKLFLERQCVEDRNYMFGYPANMTSDSSVISYLRWIESQLFYINGCGSPYSSGNYRMSQQKTELEIIARIIKNLNLDVKEYWGYITTGGTEGNLWGIREGFSKFSSGKLYFSDAAHYSVLKGVNFLPNINYQVISSKNGAILKEELLKTILRDYKNGYKGIILLLTYGTTTLGSVDDIKWIKNKLTENNIEHYIHLDAALYGGIPNNQINSPSIYLKEIMQLGIDSISISLHKYVGIPKTNGVLLAKSQMNNKFIEYIGQNDITLCGSRDFLPFTTLQKVKEIYERNNPFEYRENIEYFETLLNENNIPYEKGLANGNVFVIEKPSDEICYKYQLATFNYNGFEKAHIIIFPFHEREIIEQLILDLKTNSKVLYK